MCRTVCRILFQDLLNVIVSPYSLEQRLNAEHRGKGQYPHFTVRLTAGLTWQVSLKESSVFICLLCASCRKVNNTVNRKELQTESSKPQKIEKVMAVKYITIIHRIYEALKSKCLDF